MDHAKGTKHRVTLGTYRRREPTIPSRAIYALRVTLAKDTAAAGSMNAPSSFAVSESYRRDSPKSWSWSGGPKRPRSASCSTAEVEPVVVVVVACESPQLGISHCAHAEARYHRPSRP